MSGISIGGGGTFIGCRGVRGSIKGDNQKAGARDIRPCQHYADIAVGTAPTGTLDKLLARGKLGRLAKLCRLADGDMTDMLA